MALAVGPDASLGWSRQRRLVLESGSLLQAIFDWLDVESLRSVAVVCSRFNRVSCSEEIWQWRCLLKWPELEHATSLAWDPFPIYKSCYARKWKEEAEATSLDDLMSIFGDCDFYSCKNGHLYVIGECRIPIEVATCPECGEPIGGRYHKMLETNSRVGDVSSAAAPWRRPGSADDGTAPTSTTVGFDDIARVITESRDAVMRTGDGTMDPRMGIPSDGPQGGQALETISVKWATTEIREVIEERLRQGLRDPPPYLVCPITHELFADPVSTPSGFVYERRAIEDWLADHDTDPQDPYGESFTGQALREDDDTRRAAEDYRRVATEMGLEVDGRYEAETAESRTESGTAEVTRVIPLEVDVEPVVEDLPRYGLASSTTDQQSFQGAYAEERKEELDEKHPW